MLLQEIKQGVNNQLIEANADAAAFGDERVGLQQKTKYIAIIAGVSADDPFSFETNRNGRKETVTLNKNLVIYATPLKDYDETKSNWGTYTVGSRAFVDAGVVSGADKVNAVNNKSMFIVSWETRLDEKDEVIKTNAGTPKKFYSSKVYSEE